MDRHASPSAAPCHLLTVIVPTFSEAPNIAVLVDRLGAALSEIDAELIFVDDSRDETPQVIAAVAQRAPLPVRMIHRDAAVGGLSGAVQEGLAAAASQWCVVMDGDLQHPPELVPALLEAAVREGVDVVVASRYLAGGSAGGLASIVRRLVSSTSTTVTRAMFPVRLADCSDPMTGFFLVRRKAVNLAALRPRGFKILLEILVRNRLKVAEIPFAFGERNAGESKASVAQGLHFLTQLAALRFGRMSRFAVIGGFGALVNIAIVWLLTQLGLGYMWAAIIAAESTIVMNFLLQERFVFRDLLNERFGVWGRLWHSLLFNNVETAIRLPLLALMVNSGQVAAVPGTAITLLVAFVVRFTYHSRVIYRPRRRTPAAERLPVAELDARAGV